MSVRLYCRDVRLYCRDLNDKAMRFLDRPGGGLEVEMLIATVELWQVFLLLFITGTLWETRAYKDFVYMGISEWAVVIPWAIAGVSSWIGIILFFFGYKVCAPFRWLGSFFSTILWGWVGIKTGIIVDWNISYIAVCFLFSIWSIRISFSAFRRWELWRYILVRNDDRS